MRHAKLICDYCAGVCDPAEPASTKENDSGRLWADPCPVGFLKWTAPTNRIAWGCETIWPVDHGRNVQLWDCRDMTDYSFLSEFSK